MCWSWFELAHGGNCQIVCPEISTALGRSESAAAFEKEHTQIGENSLGCNLVGASRLLLLLASLLLSVCSCPFCLLVSGAEAEPLSASAHFRFVCLCAAAPSSFPRPALSQAPPPPPFTHHKSSWPAQSLCGLPANCTVRRRPFVWFASLQPKLPASAAVSLSRRSSAKTSNALPSARPPLSLLRGWLALIAQSRATRVHFKALFPSLWSIANWSLALLPR